MDEHVTDYVTLAIDFRMTSKAPYRRNPFAHCQVIKPRIWNRKRSDYRIADTDNGLLIGRPLLWIFSLSSTSSYCYACTAKSRQLPLQAMTGRNHVPQPCGRACPAVTYPLAQRCVFRYCLCTFIYEVVIYKINWQEARFYMFFVTGYVNYLPVCVYIRRFFYLYNDYSTKQKSVLNKHIWLCGFPRG